MSWERKVFKVRIVCQVRGALRIAGDMKGWKVRCGKGIREERRWKELVEVIAAERI